MNAGPTRRSTLRRRLLVLIVVAVPALLAGVILYPVYAEWSREREVIDLLEARKLHYTRDPSFEILTGMGITLFDRVVSVTPVYGPRGMTSDPLSDADLRDLGSLRHLRFLAIEAPITDAGLPVLLGFQHLDQLIVHRTELSADAIEQLRQSIPKVSLSRWGE